MRRVFIDKFKVFIIWFLLIFILIASANLVVELLMVVRAYVPVFSGGKGIVKDIYLTKESDNDFIIQHSNDIFEGYKNTNYAYPIGPVRDFSKAISFNGAADGRRITPDKFLSKRKYQGIMFGASQSWGYFVDDKYIVSQILMDKLEDVAVDNYSLLGLTLEQILLYWQSVEGNVKNKKFALVIGGVLDVMNYCYFEPYTFKTKNQPEDYLGLFFIYNKLYSRFNDDSVFCKKESDINSVVQRIVNSIDAILQLAKKNNVKVLVVIPPIPFYGSANVSNIAANYSFSKMKSATFPVYKKLDERISQLEHETVINLMHAFSDDEIYFLDSIGHLTEKGHNKLAEKIIEKAGRFFVINND